MFSVYIRSYKQLDEDYLHKNYIVEIEDNYKIKINNLEHIKIKEYGEKDNQPDYTVLFYRQLAHITNGIKYFKNYELLLCDFELYY